MPNLAILAAATTYQLLVVVAGLATTSSYLPDFLAPFITSLPSYHLQVVHFHRPVAPQAAAEAAFLEVIHQHSVVVATVTCAITTAAASASIAAITFTFTSTITSSSSTTAVASALSLTLAAASRQRRKLSSLRSGWRPGPGRQDPVVSQRCLLLYVAEVVVQLIGRCLLSLKGPRG